MWYVFIRIDGEPICERVVSTLKMEEHGRSIKVLKLADGSLIRSHEGIQIEEDTALLVRAGDHAGMQNLIRETWHESDMLKLEGHAADAEEMKAKAETLEEIAQEVWGGELEDDQ